MARALWKTPDKNVLGLFEQHAPHIIALYAGMLGELEKHELPHPDATPPAECTSFSASPDITLDGVPISGQTKDTDIDSIPRYIVLRMRISDAPTILVLAYPWEVLGYGMWATGMTVFRNSLYSSAGAQDGLDMHQWALLALAQHSVHNAAELALEHGIRDCGNVLLSDGSGASVNVEFNCGGVNIIEAKDGISTHANHPVGPDTSVHEDYPNAAERKNSRFRAEHLRELIETESPRFTAQKAMSCLASHDEYPLGICRHIICDEPTDFTTAGVVAEPTKGLLHVVRGNPCCNWPVSYCL